MKHVVIAKDDVSILQLPQLTDMLSRVGARVTTLSSKEALPDSATVLVGRNITSALTMAAFERSPRVPVVFESWVRDCFDAQTLIPPGESNHMVPPLYNLHFCITGADLKVRSELDGRLKKLGARYDGALRKGSTTHLLTGGDIHARSSKIIAARKWGNSDHFTCLAG